MVCVRFDGLRAIRFKQHNKLVVPLSSLGIGKTSRLLLIFSNLRIFTSRIQDIQQGMAVRIPPNYFILEFLDIACHH